MFTITKAMVLCERHVRDQHVDFAKTYGEPGYTDPEAGILFANWNDCPTWLIDGLERRGYVLEWSDEWIISHENSSKAYRTSPNCHTWKPYYVFTPDGDVVGGDEIEGGSEEKWYVEGYLLNDPLKCNLFQLDLASHGFQPFNGTFETGFHPGQNDSPGDVFVKIQKEKPNHDVIFNLCCQGQFDAHWTVWVRPQAEN